MDNMKHRRLQELDRSDFGIVEGEPDIRGWDVKTASGQKIGEVEELIIDAQKQKVRYMVVELDDDDLDLEDDKEVLIPIGLAELDKDDDDVILPSVTVEQLRALPAYDADNLNDEAERSVCTALGRNDETISTSSTAKDTTHQTESAGTQAEKPGSTVNPALSTANAAPSHLGTPEYYASFYQHPYFNDENLSRNRSQEGRSQRAETESEYERGLQLWEMRSEGGIIPTDTHTGAGQHREISNEQRKEMIRSRRAAYEERRSHRKGKSIIDRINEEGLQDAKH
jgi:sporulation protein YlmC with PRC-barrel domain